MQRLQKLTKEWIIENKHSIYAALQEGGLSKKEQVSTPLRAAVILKARVELDYNDGTSNECIWSTMSKLYYKV